MAVLTIKLTHFIFVSMNLHFVTAVVAITFISHKKENNVTMETQPNMMVVLTLAKYFLIGTALKIFLKYLFVCMFLFVEMEK